jgi:DNA-binding CsgD family transcriptional regulator
VALSPGDDFVTFEFAALCYADPEQNQFAYMLEGRDRDWIHLGTQRTVTLAHLPPGRFTLRVRAANPDRVWNEEGIAIQIRKPRSFWSGPWFFGLIFLILGGVLGVLYRYRRLHLRAQADFESALSVIFEKYKISAREREILRLVIDGKPNREIEELLFISENTVRNHIYNIYKKLGVKNRLELLNLLRRHTG